MSSLFGKRIFREKVEGEKTHDAYDNMRAEISKKGGNLSFNVILDEQGWFAECNEFPAIITGGDTPKPTDEEINRSIIEAVKTTFHLPIQELNFEGIESKLKFTTITTKQERCVSFA